MGGDAGPAAVVAGIATSASKNPEIGFVLNGPRDLLEPLVSKRRVLSGRVDYRDAADVVTMEDKPSQVVRQRQEHLDVVDARGGARRRGARARSPAATPAR